MSGVIIIGVSGPSASGKTLLANSIVEELGSSQVTLISEDSYYKCNAHLKFEERTRVNYDHPESLDHELLCQNLLELRKGHAALIPIYDHATHSRQKEWRRISDKKIIVLEGILIFNDPRLREMMDIKIFMDAPLDICLTRRLRRDTVERGRSVESVLTQYETTVRPMFLQFIEPSKRFADIIVPKGGRNKIALDLIKAKMRELLPSN